MAAGLLSHLAGEFAMGVLSHVLELQGGGKAGATARGRAGAGVGRQRLWLCADACAWRFVASVAWRRALFVGHSGVASGWVVSWRCAAFGGCVGGGMWRDAAVRACADALPAKGWRRLPSPHGDALWVAECERMPNRGRAPFRLILPRRQGAQAALGAGFELTAAFAAGLDGACEEILALYARRGECENRIKEWKSGFAAGRPPCSDHRPNWAWTRLNALAYNLAILMRRLLWKPMR